MQFIVFAAFAIVLSVPVDGPPWRTLHSPAWTAILVVGQVVLVGLVGGVTARSVKGKLEREPAWLPSAQQRLARGGVVIRTILLSTFAASMYLTDWSRYVRSVPSLARVYGLDEMVMLLPFLVAVLVSWIALYPADRGIRQVALEARLWASQPSRPVWRLSHYLLFMFRHHVLVILLPMLPIVMAIDMVSTEHFGGWLRRRSGLIWADQAVLVAVAGVVFFFVPVVLRYVWHTKPLPASDLRARLEAMCRRIGLRYREILLWESDGMVVNAAVMGLLWPVRYILLSDGLLETLDDRKVEAVFGHEVGHVRHHHITFYLLFAILSMLIVGGVNELVVRGWPDLIERYPQTRDYLQVTAMGLIVLVWGVAFGPVSKRFEWQADLFGARRVTPPPDACDRPCLLHGTAGLPVPEVAQSERLVCATAAHIFGEALHSIAVLNGIPIEARSWRHSSIGNRIRLLREYALHPEAVARLGRAVVTIKTALIIGTAVGLVIAAYLYWPTELIARCRAQWGG